MQNATSNSRTVLSCLLVVGLASLVFGTLGCQHSFSDTDDASESSTDQLEGSDDGTGKADDGNKSKSAGSYDPCGNKSCGDRCTKCPPNDANCVETQVIKFCQADGSCQATQPQCQAQGSCTSDADCSSGEYCEKSGAKSCSAKTSGTCEAKPSACTQQYDPVCGCDGTTYGNACEAASAGVNVAHKGTCGATGGCTSDADCGSDEYCEKSGSKTCSPKTSGSCTAKPNICTEDYAPVCGCDGTTYANDCKAAAAGVNIAHTGEC